MSVEMESMWGAMKGLHYERTLQQLKNQLQATQSSSEAMVLALDTVVRAAHAVAGTMWIYDKYNDGHIHPKAVYGGGNLGNVSLLPGEGIAGQVIKSGEAIIVADCQKDSRWAGRVDEKTNFRTESMICTPLTMDDLTFGCIQIINKNDGLIFDEDDILLVVNLSAAIGILFRENGFLDHYRKSQEEELGARRAVTFMQVLGVTSPQEMEYQLRRINEFSMLGSRQQSEVLQLMKQLQPYFAPKRKRGGFFRLG